MNATAAVGKDARLLSAEFLILVAGATTSILTAAINTVLIRKADLNFLSVSHWLVIPTGALCGGMAAASGYYFAAVWTHTMPSRKFLVEMAAIGASTWLLALWLEYASLSLSDGTNVSDYLSFADYFRFQAEHTTLRLGTTGSGTETGELGTLGYAREFVQLFGFLVGGAAVWGFLKDREACENCRKYAKTKSLLTADTPDRFQSLTDGATIAFPGMVEEAETVLAGQAFVGLDLVLAECPKCHRTWARPSVVCGRSTNPNRQKLAAYTVTSDQAAALRSAAESLPKVKK